MFAHSRNIAITGGNFAVNVGNSAFKDLQKASAPSAFHNSSARFDPPKCHPNTRVAILEYVMGWIFGRNDPDALILWLYGPAGAGKSAIVQTIAERCFERKALLASFFFGRSDPTRNTFKPLVATIAYQIATAIPEIKPHLESIIERDPLIFEKSIATQLQSLVVEPLKVLAASGFFTDLNPWARLVLIDGLDECDDPRMQSMILRALANVLHDEKLPLIFLVASRPEQHITLTFNSPPLTGLWRSLVLDNSFKPDDDIRLFLEDSFREIRTTHPHRSLIPKSWPEPLEVDKLIRKSSGQFIYASVVVKYVSAPIDRPPRRLEVIMGLRPARRDIPFSELDALYTHILSSCADPDVVLRILGHVVTGTMSPAVDYIEMLHDLEAGDVEIALAPLASIIHVEESLRAFNVSKKCVELYHASLGDFLVDVSRSGPFYINTLTVKENVVCKCLRKLMDPSSTTGYKFTGWDLQQSLHSSWHDITLTEKVETALNEFSLPQFWSSWLPEFNVNPDGVESLDRIGFILLFLKFLSERKRFDPSSVAFSTIYDFHLSSFESVIKSEISNYYQDVGLTSLVVVAMLDEEKDMPLLIRQRAQMPLFRLTAESMKFDDDTLCLKIPGGLRVHYSYLFTGPEKLAEMGLDGDKHAQTALRILEFLCNYPPYPIRYQENHNTYQTPKSTSRRGRAPGRASRYLMPRFIVARTMRLTSNNFPRKRRQEKHRHGVALSVPDIEDDRYLALSLRFPPPPVYASPTEHHNLTQMTCTLGLLYLPEILNRSSRSLELVNFIRRYGRDVVFIPKQTRKAICAMHVYLDRVDENSNMVID